MFRQKAAVCTCYLCPDVCQSPLARGQPKTQDTTAPCCLVQPHISTPSPIPAGKLPTRFYTGPSLKAREPLIWENLYSNCGLSQEERLCKKKYNGHGCTPRV